jgi:hypothetical protein
MHRCAFAVSLGLLILAPAAAHAQMRITEWMYAGANGEFVELTNMGDLPVDMRDEWYYSDSDQGETDLDLAKFGLVQPGESVIVTEAEESAFRTAWALDPAVKILGSNINSNLSRVDEINIFHSDALIDRLTYGDNRVPEDPPLGAPATAGSIRAQARSGIPNSLAALGANDVFEWTLASTAAQGADPFGTYSSTTGGDRANPGFFYLVLTGDYNGNSHVDAADYVVWRNSGGTADAYAAWRANFGRSQVGPTTTTATIPEPSAATIALGLIVAFVLPCRRPVLPITLGSVGRVDN